VPQQRRVSHRDPFSAVRYLISESREIRAHFFPAWLNDLSGHPSESGISAKDVAFKLTEGAVDKLCGLSRESLPRHSRFLVMDGERRTYHQEAATKQTNLCSYRSDAMTLAGPWGQETGSRTVFPRDATIDVVRAQTHMLLSSVNCWALSPALPDANRPWKVLRSSVHP